MLYLYLLAGGGIPALMHFYLVWKHREKGIYSISGNAVADKQSHQMYFAAHLAAEVLILLFSYNFYITRHHVWIPHLLNINFAIFDFLQAAVPSRGKTKKAHAVMAYVSWVSYILSGIVALFTLHIRQPFLALSLLFLLPALGMFAYIHVKRSKLYPYQLAIVPLYVFYLLFLTLGAR